MRRNCFFLANFQTIFADVWTQKSKNKLFKSDDARRRKDERRADGASYNVERTNDRSAELPTAWEGRTTSRWRFMTRGEG